MHHHHHQRVLDWWTSEGPSPVERTIRWLVGEINSEIKVYDCNLAEKKKNNTWQSVHCARNWKEARIRWCVFGNDEMTRGCGPLNRKLVPLCTMNRVGKVNRQIKSISICVNGVLTVYSGAALVQPTHNSSCLIEWECIHRFADKYHLLLSSNIVL